MIGMKVRYEITDVNLKISNVTPREEESYVLIRVADENNTEIVFALSHEQSEQLENELFEANRRWRVHSSVSPRTSYIESKEDDGADEHNSDHYSH